MKYDKILDKTAHEISYKTKDENWTKPIPNHGNPKIKFKLTSKDAKLPQVKHEGDVGFDIYALEKAPPLLSGETTLVKTGVVLADCPLKLGGHSIYLKVEGRSGLALKGIFPVGGIIDPTYRGEIGVILYNSTKHNVYIQKGDRIAQLIIYNVITSSEIDFIESTESTKSVRGADGFGSTGK